MSMVNIGTSKEAVEKVSETILKILESGAEQKTLRCALGAFVKSVEVKNVTITDCTFTNNEDKTDK